MRFGGMRQRFAVLALIIGLVALGGCDGERRSDVTIYVNAEFHSVDGAVHMWPGLDPEGFSRLLLEFLDQH